MATLSGSLIGADNDELLTLRDKRIQGCPGFVVGVPLGADVLVLVACWGDSAIEYGTAPGFVDSQERWFLAA